VDVQDAYVDNNGVNIHYVTKGQGKPVVLVHGFPDFWYSWRYQIEPLAARYKVAALDLRGYNLSDKPEGAQHYDMAALASDVTAVIRALGAEKACIVGHDWGGAIAWWLAIFEPGVVERLAVCNLPHPRGFLRELAHNPEQQKNSAYARAFQEPNAHEWVTPEALAQLPSHGDPQAYETYCEAFRRSNIEAMLQYYKVNYPREPYVEPELNTPPVTVPVLQFHGLKDSALHHHALNCTWEWISAPYTLCTVPNADHWVHHDAADWVTRTLLAWLALTEY
jgi:pimeloyl-ACP methyl ester carboxylesterase